jgi:two-component system OmpR family response regulator
MTTNWHILSMDNDPRRRGQVHDYLGRHGFEVSTAFTPRDLWRKLDHLRIDLLLLGPNAHGDTDLDLVKQIRGNTDLPMIVADAPDDDSERIIALELGADDYLRRPFSPRELLARIRSFQRRSHGGRSATPPSRVYRFAGWTFAPQRASLRSPGGAVSHLTTSERRLLQALVDAPQRVLSRERLLRLIADDDQQVQERSVDMMIWRLRRKLGNALICTERGAGYSFSARVDVTTEDTASAAIRQ